MAIASLTFRTAIGPSRKDSRTAILRVPIIGLGRVVGLISILPNTTQTEITYKLGVYAISLQYRESRRIDQYGNEFRYRAKVYDVHGEQVGRWAWDVFFVKQ
jgi:hypothetical protein